MLYKSLILTVSAFVISSIFAIESQAVVKTLDGRSYEEQKLVQDLTLATPTLETTVTDRVKLSDPTDRVNAASGPAQYLLVTATKHPMSIGDYYNSISVQTRQKSFDNQNLRESIIPIVTAQVTTSRPLTDDEITSLKPTAHHIVRNGNSLTILHGTRNSIKHLMNLDPTATVHHAFSCCVPAPVFFHK